MVHYMLRPEVKLYARGEHGESAGGKGLIWRVSLPVQPPLRADARSRTPRCCTGAWTIARWC